MRFAHEITRFIGSDRDGGEVRRAQPFPCFGEVGAVARVSGEIELVAIFESKHETDPQRLVPVEGRARGPVPHRCRGDHRSVPHALLPPVDFRHIGEPGPPQIARKPQRHNDPDFRLHGSQAFQAGKIEMVVMRMRYHQNIDLWQGFGRICRRHHPFRAAEGERRRAVRKHRVRQHADTVTAEQQRGMPDPCNVVPVPAGGRRLQRVQQRHPVLLRRVPVACEKGTGKAQHIEQPLVVAIARRMFEPVPGFVILRGIHVGLHRAASCEK